MSLEGAVHPEPGYLTLTVAPLSRIVSIYVGAAAFVAATRINTFVCVVLYKRLSIGKANEVTCLRKDASSTRDKNPFRSGFPGGVPEQCAP
jgi:hypothetical protein